MLAPVPPLQGVLWTGSGYRLGGEGKGCVQLSTNTGFGSASRRGGILKCGDNEVVLLFVVVLKQLAQP